MNQAIVTNGLLRKSLAAVRSLGRRGVPAYTAESTRITPAGMSRYCVQAMVSPNPSVSSYAYAAWLSEVLQRMPGAVLMPMDDDSLSAVLEHEASLASVSRFLLPSKEMYQLASDKYTAICLAKSIGMDCPLTWLPEGEADLPVIAAQAGFPLVIKPRRSTGSRGIRIVNGIQQLKELFQASSASFRSPPMIQEFIPPGERYDAALLFDSEGKTAASFVQREVRHYPPDIGPSTVQESVWMPQLVEQASALLKKFQWRGIAEVEWMQDPRDGKLKLMEINARYWNSLHLAIQSGVDFPYLHYRLSIGKRISPQETYSIGQITRNLLPGDLLHAWAARRWRVDPPLFGRAGLPIQDDILSWKDPMPAVGFAGACLRYLFDKRMWAALTKR